MKLVIIAAILILSGIPNISNPDKMYIGIGCVFVGAAIIAIKLFLAIRSTGSDQHSPQSSPQSSVRFDPAPAPRTHPPVAIQRDKNPIPEGLLTDTAGKPFPISAVQCILDPRGLMRIDNNFYEITSDQNIATAKALILAINQCLDEAAAQRSDFPAHRFSGDRLRFKFDPYAGSRTYCTASFDRISRSGRRDMCCCTLHINYSDDLFGSISFDSVGACSSAKIISWRRKLIERPDRLEYSGDCFIVNVVYDSGVPSLQSVCTKQEEELMRQKRSDAWHAVHEKWKSVIDEHTELLNDIGVAYTIANNLGLPSSPQMEHVIDLCQRDIALAESFVRSQLEIQNVREANGWSEKKNPADVLPNFPTFKRLAIIYEKQGNYAEAIAVCQRAIELGFVNDGTDGQMPGRIARLMRKKGKSAKKIAPAEEIVSDEISAETSAD